MDPIRTNAARRLHALLKRARGPECQGKPSVQALSVLFKIPDNEKVALYRAFSKLLQLVSTTQECVKLLPDDQAEDYATCFEPIFNALGSIQFAGPWQINENLVRPQELALLNRAGDALNAVVPEHEIEESELASMKDELEALRQDVGNSDISIKLKALLLFEISRLLDAIADYVIGGAAGIREAAATSFGRVVVDREILFPEREKPIVTKFYTCVGRIADVAAVALLARQLGQAGAELLVTLLQ